MVVTLVKQLEKKKLSTVTANKNTAVFMHWNSTHSHTDCVSTRCMRYTVFTHICTCACACVLMKACHLEYNLSFSTLLLHSASFCYIDNDKV